MACFTDRNRKGWKKPDGGGAPLVLVKGPSLVKITKLEELLKDYPDQGLVIYLLQGFTVGFFIPYQVSHSSVMLNNFKSIQGMEHFVKTKLGKKLNEGRPL